VTRMAAMEEELGPNGMPKVLPEPVPTDAERTRRLLASRAAAAEMPLTAVEEKLLNAPMPAPGVRLYGDDRDEIDDAEWLALHADQLGPIPAAVRAVVARKMNAEIFDAYRTFNIMDVADAPGAAGADSSDRAASAAEPGAFDLGELSLDPPPVVVRAGNARAVVATEGTVKALSDAWIADHAMTFGHGRDAAAAIDSHPGLVNRFAGMACCDDEDVLDLCVWRFARDLPRRPLEPPTFYVEDEVAAAMTRDYADPPDALAPRVGSAPLTCVRTGDTFTVLWPATDLPRGSRPKRDPFPRLPVWNPNRFKIPST